MPIDRKALATRLAFVCLAGLALANSGCLVAAAGVAAAGGTAAYMYVEGKVEHSYVADLRDVQAAVRTSLAELRMPIAEEKIGPENGSLVSRTAADERVEINLEMHPGKIPAEGPITTVAIRVAVFGDKVVSNRIFDQINLHLAYAPPAGPPPPGAPVPASAPPVNGVTQTGAQLPAQSPPPPLAH